jgi:hypothetical protein
MLQKISGKELVVDRIFEQIVGPKINSALLPEVSIELFFVKRKMIMKFLHASFKTPKSRKLLCFSFSSLPLVYLRLCFSANGHFSAVYRT